MTDYHRRARVDATDVQRAFLQEACMRLSVEARLQANELADGRDFDGRVIAHMVNLTKAADHTLREAEDAAIRAILAGDLALRQAIPR